MNIWMILTIVFLALAAISYFGGLGFPTLGLLIVAFIFLVIAFFKRV